MASRAVARLSGDELRRSHPYCAKRITSNWRTICDASHDRGRTFKYFSVQYIARIAEADLACHVAAQEALARIGEPAVAALVDALKVTSDNRRIGSAKALGEIGPSAAAALPLLETLATTHGAEIVRRAASEAIKRIKPRRWFSF